MLRLRIRIQDDGIKPATARIYILRQAARGINFKDETNRRRGSIDGEIFRASNKFELVSVNFPSINIPLRRFYVRGNHKEKDHFPLTVKLTQRGRAYLKNLRQAVKEYNEAVHDSR